MKLKILLGVALALSLLVMPSVSHAAQEQKGQRAAPHARSGGGGGARVHAPRAQATRAQAPRVQRQNHVNVNRGNRVNVQRANRTNIKRGNNVRVQQQNVQRKRTTTIRNRKNVNKTVIDNKNVTNRKNNARRANAHRARPNFSNNQRVRARTFYRGHRNNFHRVARVAWPVAIGGFVPRDYEVYDMPSDFYGYVPGYEGYKYIVVGDQLLIIDPETWEIVAIIPL